MSTQGFEAALQQRLSAEGQEASMEAAYFLGLWLLCGRYRPRDAARAAQLLQQAHEAGHSGATIQLAHLYETGRGVGKDCGRAFELYEEAARRGEARGLRAQALCYMTGR